MSTLAVDNITDEVGTGLPELNGSVPYARNNILGTVSESSGVPTGAIIERGSNANGEFVKYADGTMIHTLDFTMTYVGSTELSFGTHTFPVSFISRPSVTITPSGSGTLEATTGTAAQQRSGALSPIGWLTNANSTVLTCRSNRTSVAFQSGDSFEFGLIALGRWY